MDLLEHNGNHATLFFTSVMTVEGINYTVVNTVDILRLLKPDGGAVYKT
jgi:hypothetical protein